MMNDGLVVSWGAQGRQAAEQMGRWLGVEIVWFDGNLDLNQQRSNMAEIAQEIGISSRRAAGQHRHAGRFD